MWTFNSFTPKWVESCTTSSKIYRLDFLRCSWAPAVHLAWSWILTMMKIVRCAILSPCITPSRLHKSERSRTERSPSSTALWPLAACGTLDRVRGAAPVSLVGYYVVVNC